MPTSDVLQFLTLSLGVDSLELSRWALGWARLTPVVVIVPAFGLRAVPGPMRVALALCLAIAIAPALRPARGEAPRRIRAGDAGGDCGSDVAVDRIDGRWARGQLAWGPRNLGSAD